jgi:hypothetical protein
LGIGADPKTVGRIGDKLGWIESIGEGEEDGSGIEGLKTDQSK